MKGHWGRTATALGLLGGFVLSVAEMPLPLRVAGTRILNARNQPVVLRGVNTACLEWTSDGEGHILDTVRVAVKDWNANIIRLPLSQDRWFGMGPEQKDKGVSYRALVKKVVDYCADNGTYVMLDLHWNDAGEWGRNIGQHVMPDMNSVTFWRDCARTYRNHPAVLFDLYNEPHDTTWEIWLNGGEITEDRGPGARQGAFAPVKYRTPGMQALLNVVRSTGANNVVVAGGLDWSYDMSGMLTGKTLKDPNGHGVIYANHAYPFKGDTVQTWIAKMERAEKELPFIVSEFGSQTRGDTTGRDAKWVEQVLGAMRSHRWNWTAWDLHPAAGPTLISDWKYTPTPSFGVPVKRELAEPLGG
jgi:hypothetical protein